MKQINNYKNNIGWTIVKYAIALLIMTLTSNYIDFNFQDEEVEHNITHNEISEEDLLLLTKLINSESHSENFIDKLYVGSSVLNRMNNNNFPNTLDSVIYQKNQYAGIHNKLFRYDPTNYNDRTSYSAAYILLHHGVFCDKVLFFFNPKTSTNRKWVNHMYKNHEVLFNGTNHDYF